MMLKVDELLKENKLEPKQIDQILLVGGTTRLWCVKERLQDKFKEAKLT